MLTLHPMSLTNGVDKMKRIILFAALLTGAFTCVAHSTHAPEGPTFLCLPNPDCQAEIGKSDVVGYIPATGGFGMIHTHASLLTWSSWDLAHYGYAQSWMVMIKPGTASYYRAYKVGQATANNYTVHYWISNLFGNGVNVQNDSQWAVGYRFPWSSFVPQWYYEVTTTTGPITKL